MAIVGVDGCKFGWVAISDEEKTVRLFKHIGDLVSYYSSNSNYFIDIPIGLPSILCPRRDCEAIGRKLLAKRSSSLFSVPCREAIYEETFEQANISNKKILSKGVSIQTWRIIPKIREVDLFLRKNRSLIKNFKESHPELVFYTLNNKTNLKHSKKTSQGNCERLEIVKMYNSDADKILNKSLRSFYRVDVKKDDIVDAMILCAFAIHLNKQSPINQNKNLSTDQYGLEMKIYYEIA